MTILATVIVLLVIYILIRVATINLWSLPLLSYQQGNAETEFGVVTEVKTIAPKVTEVSLRHQLQVDPAPLSPGSMTLTAASFTTYIHFRGNQLVPNVGDQIQVTSVNRLHHFTGRSFNWVKQWKKYEGPIQTQGKVTQYNV